MRTLRWPLSVVGLVLVAIYLFPVYWMASASFKTSDDLNAPDLVPLRPTLSVWSRILGDPRVPAYVEHSVLVALGTMVLTVLLGAPAAYSLARYRIKGRTVVMFFCLSSLMFPSIMLATPLFVIFTRLHLINSFLGLIIADTTLALPYAIVLLRPVFADIANDYTEAAQLDGCTPLGAFWRIALPLARPGLAMVAVLSFLWGWGDLVFALTLASDDSHRVVTTGLWGFFGANTSDWNGAMAFSTLAMLPPLVVFLLAQRQVIAGLGTGGLKG